MSPLVLTFSLRVKPAGKERPRVTKRGTTYMPKEYEVWRSMVAWMVRSQVPAAILPRLPLTSRLAFACTVSVPRGDMRPDLDNLVGAVWDSIQVPTKGGWGLILNDKQFKRLIAEVIDGPTCIRFTISEIA